MLDITVTVVFKAVPGTFQQTIGCGLPLIEKTNKHKTNGSFFFLSICSLKINALRLKSDQIYNDKKDNRQSPSHGVSNDTQVPEYMLILLKANLFCVFLIFNKSDSAGYVTFCQYTM